MVRPELHESQDFLRAWPSFTVDGRWPATRDYLHLISQMLGKLRLALAPPLPEWSHTPLSMGAQGLTTGAMPWRDGALEASLVLPDHCLRLSASDGRSRSFKLRPVRPISELWSSFNDALRDLGVAAELWDKPQERSDATPFSLDDRPRDYDPTLAAAWFALLLELRDIFDEFRSPFFGRSGVNFWWGGFDLTVTLFNGRRATPPAGSNLLMRHDLDAEHLSIGFWPGDGKRQAMFFGYLVPEPVNCAEYPFEVSSAAWAPTMSEWVLPYESVRASADRRGLLRQFMDTVYRAADDLGGWDLDAHTYHAPPAGPGGPRDRG
jgi:hypothetical protein